jgi:hypothetical protein
MKAGSPFVPAVGDPPWVSPCSIGPSSPYLNGTGDPAFIVSLREADHFARASISSILNRTLTMYGFAPFVQWP